MRFTVWLCGLFPNQLGVSSTSTFLLWIQMVQTLWTSPLCNLRHIRNILGDCIVQIDIDGIINSWTIEQCRSAPSIQVQRGDRTGFVQHRFETTPCAGHVYDLTTVHFVLGTCSWFRLQPNSAFWHSASAELIQKQVNR